MFGGGTGTMTLDELLVLEKHLELWIYNIRSTKVSLIFFFFFWVFENVFIITIDIQC